MFHTTWFLPLSSHLAPLFHITVNKWYIIDIGKYISMNPLHSPVYLENGHYLMVLGHWRASSVQHWPFALLANTQGNISQTEAAQRQQLPHQHKPTQEVIFLLHHIQYNKTGEISAVWRESRTWHSGSKMKEIVSFHSIPFTSNRSMFLAPSHVKFLNHRQNLFMLNSNWLEIQFNKSRAYSI